MEYGIWNMSFSYKIIAILCLRHSSMAMEYLFETIKLITEYFRSTNKAYKKMSYRDIITMYDNILLL